MRNTETRNHLQRTLAHLRNRGVRATVRRVAAELAARLGRPPTAGSRPPHGENRGDIHCHVDLPAPDSSIATHTLDVAGWAFSRSGGACSIDIFVDEAYVASTTPGLPRPDVAEEFPGLSGAAGCGFSESLPIPELGYGAHSLTLVVSDDAGGRLTVGVGFYCIADDRLYDRIYRASLLTGREARRLSQRLSADPLRPRFEVWVDARSPAGFEQTVHSLAAQSYDEWACTVVCAADDIAVRRQAVERWIAPEEIDRRFLFGSERAPDDDSDPQPILITVLESGEAFASHALLEVAAQFKPGRNPSVVYTDGDHIDSEDRHTQPELRPDWSPDHLLSRGYVGGVYFFEARDETLDAARAAADDGGAAWRYSLLLRLTELPCTVAHIARPLWSTRRSPADRDVQAELEAVSAALARRETGASAQQTANGVRRVHWPLPDPPRVSIIIPTTGRLEHLRPCVESLAKSTSYPDYELVFIDNGRGKHPEGIEFLRTSGFRVLTRDERFNWAKLNNDGAREATGELLLFLNDDVEIAHGEWLTELASLAIRPDIGCVGALLLYPHGTIQHAGVFLVDHGGGARHFLQGMEPGGDIPGFLDRVTREVTANTGACLMVRRSLFDSLGGFDEELALVGNDVDLCLRARNAGYRNLWTPWCRLIHHESVSRRDAAIGPDERRMWSRWEHVFLDGDAYYNANFDLERSDCALRRSPPERSEIGPDSGRLPSVNLIGYVSAEMGVGEAVRGIGRALDEVGIDFDAFDYTYGNPSRQEDDTLAHRVRRVPRFDINILHVNADLTPAAVDRLPDALFEGRHTIGYWAWELPEFPDNWIGSFEFVDEVWVPSEFVRAAVAEKSPVPVTCVPHIIDKGPGPYWGRAHFRLPEDPFLFLTMFDIHSIRERKNPDGAIAAFQQAFDGADSSVGLVVKISNATPGDEREMRALADDYENIHVLTGALPRRGVDSLISACDSFVSLHRAEGFGLPIAEAMALGRPVIATHWSGNVDYTRPDNAACVPYELRTLEKDYGPYTRGNQWAEPDVAAAADWMLRLARDPDRAAQLGRAGRATVREQLSPLRIGELIAQRFDEML